MKELLVRTLRVLDDYDAEEFPAGNAVIRDIKKELDRLAAANAPVFTAEMIEAIYAAWHGAGVDIAGGDWKRFVGMLPKEK